MKKRIGFTLVELLVVISIIAILLAVIMPAMKKAQEQAKSVICRSNAKQWGMILTMYANSNSGRFMQGYSTKQGLWMMKLRSYYNNADKARLCPKATKFISTIPNGQANSFTAWGVYGEGTYLKFGGTGWSNGIPPWGEKGLYGSYGINNWICDPPVRSEIDNSVTARPGEYWRTIYVKISPSLIPAFGDSVWEGTCPWYTDLPAKVAGVSSTLDGMWNYCIPRHGTKVDWVFLDGSAQRISIRELWNLKWSVNFRTGANIDWNLYPYAQGGQ